MDGATGPRGEVREIIQSALQLCFMNTYSESTERTPTDYVRFALGFLGFMIASGGVVVASPALAVLGFLIFLLVLLSFAGRE